MTRRAEWLILATLVAGVAALAFVASHLALDYWDGFDYLGNARTLAGHGPAGNSFGFNHSRPPLISLLAAPLLRFYRPEGRGTSVTAVHLLFVALAAVGLWACYGLFRLAFSRVESLAGALLVMLNPLFIHYAPFVMADVPSMTFVALALWGYGLGRHTGRARHFAWAGAAAGVAIATKYPVFVLGGAMGAFELIRFIRPTRPATPLPFLKRARALLLDYRPWLWLATSAVTFYGIHALVYRLSGLPPMPTLDRLREGMQIAFGNNVNAFPSDPLWEYPRELVFLVSVPLLAVGGVGVVWACRRWTHADLLNLVTLVLFLGVMTFRVAHKEARYLLPIIPSLVFLQLRGFEALRLALGRVPVLSRGAVALCVLLAAPATWGAVGEGRRFADPVYRRPFLPDIARWIREKLRPEGRVVMTGCWAFNMYPKDPVVMPTDEYNHFHHLNHTSFEYYLDHRVEDGAVPATESAEIADAFPNGGAIIRLPPVFYDANSQPPAPEPPFGLRVDRIERLTLRPLPSSNPDEVAYAAADGKPLAVLTRVGEQWQVHLDDSMKEWRAYPRASAVELVRTDSREFKFR